MSFRRRRLALEAARRAPGGQLSSLSPAGRRGGCSAAAVEFRDEQALETRGTIGIWEATLPL